MKHLRYFMEWQAFGVCSTIAEKLGIATSRLRMWFIYLTFLTMGSPIIIYMILAFLLDVRRSLLAGKRNPLKYM